MRFDGSFFVCYVQFGKEEWLINQIFLIGRLVKDPELIKKDNKSSSKITLAVKRAFKNSEGIYETDFIGCTVWNVIAERICEYCHKGDLISVKGRIQNNNYLKDEQMVYTYEIIADQISYIQSAKPNDVTYTYEEEEQKEEEKLENE